MLLAVTLNIHPKKRQTASLNFIKLISKHNKNKWRVFSPFILIMLLFSNITFAQQLDNHFPNSSSIVQDKKGFIWLASPTGLIRHNSKDNIIFNSSNNNWPLPFDWVNDIHFIDDNSLLLATETHQLWLFNTSLGQAKKLNIDIHRKSIYNVVAHNGYYYLNVPNKLYRVNSQNLSTKLLSDDLDINTLKYTKKFIYISSSKGLFRINDSKLELIVSGDISAIDAADDKVIFANADTNKLTLLSDSGVQSSINIKNKVLALTVSNTQDSIFSVDQQGNINKYTLKQLAKIPHTYPNISATYVKKIFHDDSGVLWILNNYGIEQLIPSITQNTPLIFDVFINSIVLTPHLNQLIIGSYGAGLSELPSSKKALPAEVNDNFSKRAKIVTDLFSNGKAIYISTFDGLWQYNSLTKQILKLKFPENNKLLLDMTHKDGLLYLASNANGVYVYDIARNKISQHIKGKQLSSSESINVLPLTSDEVWIATSSGVDIFNTKKNLSTPLAGLGQNKVISLLEYRNKIFVATKGDGFFVYTPKGEQLAHFAKDLNFNYMSLINNEIWVSGHPGLYIVNPESYQIKMVPNTEELTFTKKPKLHKNKVYVGHYGGVLKVSLTPFSKLNSKVYISKTIASGKANLLSSTVEIESSNDVITLELASLDFRPGQEKQFKYQINNGDWNDINGNQLTLTGLSSGDYHIEIIGTNSLGQWSDFKAYADITVAYPWYWHPSSRIIYAVLITATVLLVLWLLYLRSRSISHIHQLLNEEIITHGQSTSVIRRKLEKVQNLIKSTAKAQHSESLDPKQSPLEYKQEIQVLVSECLAELKTQDSHAEPSSLSGSSLTVALPYLADYFHQQYHVLVSVQFDTVCEEIDYTIQTAIYRITYEAILAAINNGNGGVFAIHINKSNNKIWLKITDNEQSFAQFNSKINFDMAMYYIRQVANKFNATFHTYDNQEHGSEIIISIPLMKIS
jgi:ligand-binding sensor domain-containing protein